MSSSTSSSDELKYSALCIGRVWHARLLPKVHAFEYPIFNFTLDLDEIAAFRRLLGPLGWIVQFRESDHLINGEGLSEATLSGEAHNDTNSLRERVFRLISQKTNGKFQPHATTHRVVIMSHLCYYGYNFNPVSFYYILEKSTSHEDGSNDATLKIPAMVAEVSNTPWCEMYCYVLHPDSVDKVQFPTDTKTKQGGDDNDTFHCVFPKTFHVSPFMEMEYIYDWAFEGIPYPSASSKKQISVWNLMKSKDTDKTHFRAKLLMEPHVITSPFFVAWQLVRFPAFCAIIQLWIHYEAVLLFLKGIVYVPHPEGSETFASKLIANIMTPFFAMRDRFNPKSKTA